MLYNKPATTIDEQIAQLNKRGMTGDREIMRRWLHTVGYYRLSAYWLPFEQPTQVGQTRTKIFIERCSFETIIDIYVFDRKLRLLAMEAIERIEIALRSRWTNRLSLEHEAHAHLKSAAFQSGYDHLTLLTTLSKRTRNSKEVFAEHYKKKYTEPFMPPLWVVTELMSFGELSKWFAATSNSKIRSDVAKDLGLPSKESLEGTLKLLNYIRNICAHHGRLWNRRTVFRLPLIRQFSTDLVVDMTGNQRQPNNRIYNPLVVLIYMLRHQSSDTSFPSRLRELIKTRSNAQQTAMGFPNDWEDRPCWTIGTVSTA